MAVNPEYIPEGLLNSKDYAAHRGCSPAYISKLKREGRLAPPAILPNGLINLALADQMLREGGLLEGLATAPHTPSYATERALREQRTRERIELDMEERQMQLARVRGETRLRADVERETFEVMRRLRDTMLSVPVKIADKVAIESSPRVVEHLLKRAIADALGTLADELESEVPSTKVD